MKSSMYYFLREILLDPDARRICFLKGEYSDFFVSYKQGLCVSDDAKVTHPIISTTLKRAWKFTMYFFSEKESCECALVLNRRKITFECYKNLDEIKIYRFVKMG